MQKQDDWCIFGTSFPVENLDVAYGLGTVTNGHRPRLCPYSEARASLVGLARGNGVSLWDRSLAGIAWCAPASRRGPCLRNGLSRKLRDDFDHLQVEAALLPIAGKRHFEKRSVEAGSGRRSPHDRDDALQQAHDGQGTIFGDASLQVFRRSKVGGSAFA